MSGKLISFECPATVRNQLAEALRVYAEAAYPQGGSECGQVARAALQDAADLLLVDPDAASITVSRRLKPQLKAAIRYFAGLQRSGYEARSQLLLGLLAGEAVTQESWQQAEQKDAG